MQTVRMLRSFDGATMSDQDYNGDGKSDLLWQNSDGTPVIWEMNGTSIIGGGQLIDPGSSWHLIPGL